LDSIALNRLIRYHQNNALQNSGAAAKIAIDPPFPVAGNSRVELLWPTATFNRQRAEDPIHIEGGYAMNKDIYAVMRNRRSVRAYLDKPICEESLLRLGEAVNVAPTACNRQPFTFRVVLNAELRARIAEVYPQPWLQQAPAIVLAIGNREQAWKRPEGDSIVAVDAAIAMEHLVLAAAAEGLGTCWICAYDMARMNQAAGILAPWEVIAISPLGHPADPRPQPPRKPVAEIFQVIP
jgi:nitroreductase